MAAPEQEDEGAAGEPNEALSSSQQLPPAGNSSCLDVSGRQLDALPASVWHTGLVSLNAAGNRLTQWPLPGVEPGQQSCLPALRSINLSDNPGIAEIPSGCFECCSGTLRQLDLSGEWPNLAFRPISIL
jgi:hypothetical protein